MPVDEASPAELPIFSRVSDDAAITVGRVIASVSMLAAVASVVLFVAMGEFRLWYEEWGLQNALGGFLFSLLLFVAVPNEPRNGALWAIGWSGALQSITMALAPALIVLLVRNQYGVEAAADFRSVADPSTEIHFLWWLSEWTFVAALGSFMTFGFLLFPDGRLPSPRWRVVGWLAAISIGGASVGLMALGVQKERSLGPIAGVLMPFVLLAILASVTSLWFRYHRAGGDERHQLRWLAYGAVSFCVPFLSASVIDALASDGDGWSPTLGRPMALIAFPLLVGAYATALFKYRLYDIDVVISKSVTYLGLAAVITAVFATVVAIPTFIIGESDEGGPGLLLPIAATAIVAVLFEPIRSRAERWANRLVYGERSTPHEVLSRLSARLSEPGQRSGTNDLARLLAEGTGAECAAVWLQAAGTLAREGAWPADEPGISPAVPGELVEDEFSLVTPVRQGEEVLGALSVTKPRNDPLTAADRELVANVAGGAGLMLRHIGLTRSLEDRAVQVRRSRRRLIVAQDTERHRLERDLHDGAQQQVVALKVKLGLAKKLAERAGAEDIALLVSGLADETQHAVAGLRVVAHGIYPPLLEAEGLEVALRVLARTASIPLVIETTGLLRYDRDVEETVYFCVLDAVERIHMSGAHSVRVAVSKVDGWVVMDIDHDGRITEADLTSMFDRVDAFGGTGTIESLAGNLFRITSRLPAVDATKVRA